VHLRGRGLGTRLPGPFESVGLAQLAGTRLQGASLIGAQLQGASLDSAQLQGASLNHAQLQGAMLIGAQLRGAMLIGAQLQGASLFRAQLQGADFGSATLAGTDMSRAALWRTNFEGASLAAVFEDGLEQKANSKDEFASLKAAIINEVPELCEYALPRIEKLDPDISVSQASVSEALEKGRADESAYQKALAGELKTVACSGDEAAHYVVGGLIGNTYSIRSAVSTFNPIATMEASRIADAGPFAPELIESILAPDCPVSSALTEQDRANLKKLAKKAESNANMIQSSAPHEMSK
jgi:hypothetical protein